MEKTRFHSYRKYDPSHAIDFVTGDAEFNFSNPNVCYMSGGGSGGGGSAPANTTANNTDTIIQQAPAYSQQYISNLLGQAATEAAQPYQQFPGQQVADLTPDQLASFSQVEGLTGNGTGGAAATQGAAANALASSQANTASGISGAGSPYLQASAMYDPTAAAAPYEAASAMTNTPGGISAYMSPYLNNQIAGLQTLAQQNWNQFTAPGVNNSFISAGQAGSGRNEQVLGQQANLANQALTAQIASADQAAYTTAGQQAASAASNLSGLGNLAGTTAASEAANLQNIGTGLGNLQATQAGAQGAAASNLANTANTVQNTGITGASALQAVGQQQQAQNQANINTAMANFQAQNMFPEQQAGFLNSIINGLPISGGTATGTSQSPALNSQVGSVSPLSSLATSLTGAGAVLGGGKRGGLVSSFAGGGRVKGYAGDDGSLVTNDGGDDAPGFNALLSSLISGAQAQDNTPAPSTSVPAPPSGIDLSRFNPPPEDVDPNTMSAALSTSQNALPKTSTPPPTPPPDEKTQIDSPLNVDRDQAVEPSPISAHGEAQTTQNYEEPSGNNSSLSSSISSGGDSNKFRMYQLLAMAKGFSTPEHSAGAQLGDAIGNYVQVGLQEPKYQGEQQDVVSKQLGNQMNQLALQKQQALQPMQIALAKSGMSMGQGLMGGMSLSGSSGNSAQSGNGQRGQSNQADQQFAQAYRLALASGAQTGDYKTAANVLQSWAEHNPQLAGQIKNQQEQNTLKELPNGQQVMGSSLMSGQNSQNGSSAITTPSGQVVNIGSDPQNISTPPLSSILPQRDAAFEKPLNDMSTDISAYGVKPIIPGMDSIGKFKPNPSGIPAYNDIPNTKTGVALQTAIQDEDLKANAEMTSNLSGVQKEQYRLKQLADAYKQTQSGTLLAQNPDVAKQLVAWGVITDPSQIHDLSMVQKGLANQAIQVIQMTKDANANLGGAPSRLFGSEINNMQQKAENPSSTPEANYQVITDAMGLANHTAAMAKGWNDIGGLGNRSANGSTLRPADYARQFIEKNDPQDYKEAAMKSLGPFKGMNNAAPTQPIVVKSQSDIDKAPKGSILIVNGKQYRKP